MAELRSITEAFVHDDPDCPACRGEGTVCAEHPDNAWNDGDGCCGAEGMPCLRRPGVTVHLWIWHADGVLPCCRMSVDDADPFTDAFTTERQRVTCRGAS